MSTCKRLCRPVEILAALAWVLVAFPSAHAWALEPDRIHWVQVGLFGEGDTVGPSQLVAELGAAGDAPVCIYPSAQGPTVRVGEFAIYMDAYLLWEDLHETYPEATVRFNSLAEERATGREWGFQPLRAPWGPKALFSLQDHPLASATPLRFDDASAAILEGGWIPANRSSAGIASVEEEALGLFEMTESNADPARGAALLAIGDERAGRRDLQRAREVLLPVANGAVAASPEDRYQAMWLMARLYHALDWRRTAYRAYREIETVCNTPRDRALCLVEETGLLFELARSGSGRICEVQVACDRLIGQRDQLGAEPEVRRCLAAAELRAAEMQLWEGDAEGCAAATQRVIDEYPDVRHEWGLAMQWHGDALCRLGRTSEALAFYQDDLETPWGEVPAGSLKYYGQAICADHLARALDELGRQAEADDWRRVIIERWPGTRAARRAEQVLAGEEVDQ